MDHPYGLALMRLNSGRTTSPYQKDNHVNTMLRKTSAVTLAAVIAIGSSAVVASAAEAATAPPRVAVTSTTLQTTDGSSVQLNFKVPNGTPKTRFVVEFDGKSVETGTMVKGPHSLLPMDTNTPVWVVVRAKDKKRSYVPFKSYITAVQQHHIEADARVASKKARKIMESFDVSGTVITAASKLWFDLKGSTDVLKCDPSITPVSTKGKSLTCISAETKAAVSAGTVYIYTPKKPTVSDPSIMTG